ncbi:MAG: acyltransferase, partial [Planctomycetes bacterium]|nr:acyltransferase [Planctomycetota bacterium]
MNPIKNLDGVRGIAILLVVFFHLPTQPGWGGVLGLTLPFGWMGVQLFFVLSGFLITRILVGTKDHAFGAYLKRFYVRRVLRIFPLYYGYLLVLGAVYAFTSAPAQLARYWPWLATFTWNWTRADPTWEESNRFVHLWSLSVEEQFYLVWPFVVFALPRRGIVVASLVAIVACPFVRMAFADAYTARGLDPYTIYDATYWNTLGQLDAFAWGALLALTPARVLARIPASLALLGGALLFVGCGLGWQLLVVAAPPGFEDTYREVLAASAGYWFPLGLPPPLGQTTHQHVWGYTVIDVFFATVVLYAISRKDHWLLANRALVDVGKVSYGMYVLHLPVLAMVAHFGAGYADIHSWAGAAIYLTALYAASKLVFALWEQPFLRLKG